MLSSLTIRQRLIMLTLICVSMFVIFGVVLFSAMNRTKINGHLYQQIVQDKDLIADILPPPKYIIESYLVVKQLVDENDPAERDRLVNHFGELEKQFNERQKYWQDTMPEGEMRDLMLNQSTAPAQQFFTICDQQFLPAILQGDRQKAVELANGQLKALYNDHRAKIDRLVELANASAAAREDAARASIRRNYHAALALAGLSLMIMLFVALRVARSIHTQLSRFDSLLQEIAAGEGDLTRRLDIDSKDEIGQLAAKFNQFLGNLQAMMIDIQRVMGSFASTSRSMNDSTATLSGKIAEITRQIETVNSSSQDISHNVESIARSAENSAQMVQRVLETTGSVSTNLQSTAAASEQTATNVAEVAQRMDSITQNMTRIDRESADIQQGIDSSVESVKSISGVMREISVNTREASDISQQANRQAEEAIAVIGELASVSKVMGKIVKVIDDIAGQTNMLALNATIEAASAGEAGKGFVVVAGEVKELAHQTSDSTKEINEQILRIQASVSKAGEAIDHIARVIDKLNQINRDIAEQLQTQSMAAEQIASNVNAVAQNSRNMNHAVQQVSHDLSTINMNVQEANTGVSSIAEGNNRIASGAQEVSGSMQQANQQVNDISRGTGGIASELQIITQSIRELSSASVTASGHATSIQHVAGELDELAVTVQRLVGKFRV